MSGLGNQDQHLNDFGSSTVLADHHHKNAMAHKHHIQRALREEGGDHILWVLSSQLVQKFGQRDSLSYFDSAIAKPKTCSKRQAFGFTCLKTTKNTSMQRTSS